MIFGVWLGSLCASGLSIAVVKQILDDDQLLYGWQREKMLKITYRLYFLFWTSAITLVASLVVLLSIPNP
jgi:hypothetical protein